MRHLAGTHDLRLPEWGPYTKKYTGVSHITDSAKGIRYDLTVVPGLYRRKIDVPSVTWESGYHPWEATPGLDYYAFRHELEWKDQLYADISYSRISDHARLVRCEYVNRTELQQNVTLQYMSSIHYPQIGNHKPALQMSDVLLPELGLWIDALSYDEMRFAKTRPMDSLVYDGQFRGEAREHYAVGGSVLGKGFGQDAGDLASYRLVLTHDYQQAALIIRYKADKGIESVFELTGAADTTVTLSGSGEFATAQVQLGPLAIGESMLCLTALGGGAVMLDGLVIVEEPSSSEVLFQPIIQELKPKILQGSKPNSVVLKYEGSPHYYGIIWCYPQYEVREYISSELDVTMRFHVNHHGDSVLAGNGQGHYCDVFLRPIPLLPHTEKVLYAAVASGTLEEIHSFIEQFDESAEACEAVYMAARRALPVLDSNAEGEKYALGQRLMQATLLLNVVYPVYTQRAYIRHYTPGKWWDSLYTWDAGFIGIGLAELDRERAIDVLNAYVTDCGNPHAAFIHHGSPVPVQHYLFLELWNASPSEELLSYFYPRLRQYYLFLSGQSGSSTTRTLKSNLLKTWDYFYNSGGWDDYPAQVQVHKDKLEDVAAPVSVTAHAIRIAKILRMGAIALGESADVECYEADIALFAEAIHNHAWDEASGYYGYVLHDENGQPNALLRHESGDNLNRGFDGVYPLVAGVTDGDRRERLMERLFDNERMFSPIGLTAVDQSAPYYRNDGYWNGAVWLAHQWFFWKTMLDLGKAEEAYRIANTALELWKRETDASYHCLEHFIIDSGRGAGWHQFGALSAPVLNWFAAYHRPGKVNWGFDVWVKESSFNEELTVFQASYAYSGGPDEGAYFVLIHMNAAYSYSAKLNDAEVPFHTRFDGVLEIMLPRNIESCRLHVTYVPN